MTIGSGEVQPTDHILNGEYDDSDTHDKRSGQILWIRGLTRLQTQVCSHVSHYQMLSFIYKNLGFKNF